MDITRENFEECFPLISEAIEEASFLSFDAEFTGLDDGGHDYITSFDTPEDRYLKLIKPATNYIIIQFGLCAFKKLTNSNGYEVKSFNFYVFPRSSKLVPDVTFACQNSSLEFVVSQGIDFGKVITQGVSYLSVEMERKLYDGILAKHGKQMQELSPDNQNHNSSPPTNVPISQQDFVERQIKKVESALSSRTYESITLEPCSSFTRKLLYEQLNLRFPDQLFLETVSNDSSTPLLKVTFVDNFEHRKELEMKKQCNELEELRKILGFTRIIKLLHESNKLIIGHNMLLDFMHTVNQFWTTLPPDYSTFKSLAHVLFPRVLDTKHMASVAPFKDLTSNASLQILYNDLKTNKKITSFTLEIPDGFSDFTRQTCFHNAAYDAYVTGLCFLHMSMYLGTIERHLSIEEKVKTYENKVYLMKIADVPYINLAGNDLPISRDHMFHIEFVKNKKKSDLLNLFSPYGNIYIKFIDDTSAFICLSNRENSVNAIKNLSSSRTRWFRLQSYMDWYTSRIATFPNCNTTESREGPPNLKRKHADGKTNNKKLPAKKKAKQVVEKPVKKEEEKNKGEDLTNPLKLFNFETKKTEGLQSAPFFEIPDWD